MKKLLLILVIASSIELLSMEKDLQLFPWEQLPLELKTEVINSTNVQSAIDIFKKLRSTSTQYNTKEAITDFLDLVNTKSPGQEVRIARALHNQHAQEWLKKKKPGFPYEPIIEIKFDDPDADELRDLLFRKAMQATYGSNENTEDFIAQLERGLDPNVIYKLEGFGGFFEGDEHMDLVKKLVSYGLNLRGRFMSFDYLQLKEVKGTVSILTFASNAKYGKKIYEYLKNEGAE